jgi:hypothetical protein
LRISAPLAPTIVKVSQASKIAKFSVTGGVNRSLKIACERSRRFVKADDTDGVDGRGAQARTA